MLRINQNSDDAFLIEIRKKFVKMEIKIALRRHSHQVAVQAINNYRPRILRPASIDGVVVTSFAKGAASTFMISTCRLVTP